MKIQVTKQDIIDNPLCPLEPALLRLTGHKWLVSVGCAERQVEVEDEEGGTEIKTEIIEFPEAAYHYVIKAGTGEQVEPTEFEAGDPRLL